MSEAQEITNRLRSALKPDNVPHDMREQDAWLVWKVENPEGGKFNKVPHYPSGKPRGSNGTDYDIMSLGTFEEALGAFMAGEAYAGIGFATLPRFNIVAMDIDKGNADGLGTYVEVSPSGNGFHAYWRGTALSAKDCPAGLELLASSGYVTVTGQKVNGFDANGKLPVFPPDIWNKHPRRLEARISKQTHVNDSQESQESQESQDRASACADVGRFDSLPDKAKPFGNGTRHDTVFHLARHLKTLDPNVSAEAHLNVVHDWWQHYLQHFRTKPWAVTEAEFIEAYDSVRHLEGDSTVNTIWRKLKFSDIPPEFVAMRYDEIAYKVAMLCKGLSDSSNEGVFFLSNRTLAEITGWDQRSARLMLRSLVKNSVIELVEEGVFEGRMASTYRFMLKTAGSNE